ncbi:MAG TPA: ABC transporter ATP-binding protein [Firmicutes bacterium]|nr:ABC transporter ATP-binding protein [Bacillota bacterium]
MAIPFVETIFSSSETTAVAPQANSLLNKSRVPERIDREILKPKAAFFERLKLKLESKTNQLIRGKTKRQTLKHLCLVLALAVFLKNLFGYLHAYLIVHVEEGVARDFRNNLYEHFQNLPLSYFDKNRAGVLISRVTNDVGVLNRSLRVVFTTLVQDLLLVFLYLGILLVLSWRLTLFVIAVLPVTLWIIAKIGLKLRKYSARAQGRMADITSVLQETISGIRVMKAFAMERFEIAKFRQATQRYFNTVMKRIRVGKLASPVTEFWGTAVGLLLLFYGGLQVLEGGVLAPKEFIGFLVVLFSLTDPLKRLGRANSQIQEGLAAGERIFEVLDTRPSIQNSRNALSIREIKEGIRFVDVWFRYENGKNVLKHIELEIKAGETLALVGPTGSGKSTLVDLIPRFYDPYRGRVEIDGIDLRKIELGSLRRLMGIVTQETILFNDTVWNNIAYGVPQMPEEKVIQAAKAANAHDFILKLPQGYQTLIGDRGVRLSGGERQRLAIARAILKNPGLLIFDEATSALDTEAELLVQEAITRLIKGRTSIVIAHRLSTVQSADRIVVLDNGQIVQQGSHQQLMKEDGLYRILYRKQFRDNSNREDFD